MRSLRNTVLLVALGVVLPVVSCTLITDVDRSRIPEGTSGGSAGAGGTDASGGGLNEGGMAGMNATGGNASGGMDGSMAGGGMGGGN